MAWAFRRGRRLGSWRVTLRAVSRSRVGLWAASPVAAGRSACARRTGRSPSCRCRSRRRRPGRRRSTRGSARPSGPAPRRCSRWRRAPCHRAAGRRRSDRSPARSAATSRRSRPRRGRCPASSSCASASSPAKPWCRGSRAWRSGRSATSPDHSRSPVSRSSWRSASRAASVVVRGSRSKNSASTSCVVVERRRQLPQDRPERVAERQHARGEEVGQRRLDVAQALEVGDEPAALDREDEVVGHLAAPLGPARRALQGVEGAVDLDRGQLRGGVLQLAALRQPLRVEVATPGRVGPPGDAHPCLAHVAQARTVRTGAVDVRGFPPCA